MAEQPNPLSAAAVLPASGEPQPAVVPAPQEGPGVASASELSGAAFVEGLLSTPEQPMAQPSAPQPTMQPMMQPSVPPVPPAQPAPPPPAMQPILPAQPPVPPPPVPQPQSYADRYSQAPSPAPVAGLEPLPELPPEQIVPDPEPQSLSQQQHHAWAAMRAQSNQNRRLAAEYREKYNGIVEAAKAFQDEKAEFANQLAERDRRIKELEDDIGRTDLAKAPEFRNRYDAPLNEIRNDLAKTLMDNGLDQARAGELSEQILLADPADIPGMISNLPTHVQGVVMVKADEADRLWTERAAALDDWRKSAQGLAAVEERGRAMIDSARISQLTDKAMEIVKNLAPAKGQVPAYAVTDPSFVADRDAKEAQFRAWVAQAPEEQRFAAMFEGFMAPKTYEMCANLWRENQELKQRMFGMRAVSAPPVYPMRSDVPPPPPPPPRTPTVAQDGYSPADTGGSAADFAASLLRDAAAAPLPQFR